VSMRIRPRRASFHSRASNGVARQDNRLSFMDQAAFLLRRVTGQESVMQCVWVYEHAVDFDALRRFHQNLGYGLMGRRIECSPLPFGRHRWVSSLGPPSDIDVAECARPRVELSDWVDERTQLPIDPEWGPGWHLGVLPMTDGSTAISLVVSHCVADGVGGLLTVVDAVKGNTRDFGYPPPGSRTRLRAMVSDARDTVQGAPEVGRTLVAAVKLAIRGRRDLARSGASRPTGVLGEDGDRDVVVPAISIHVDLDDWDARATALGGTSYSLLAGFAAKLGERMGRRRADDGAVTLIIAISDRTEDDTRANTMSLANVGVDPTQATTDLSGARVAIRQALKTVREVPDETLQLLPLIPFIPKRAVKRTADMVFGAADLPVSCSNFGDVDPAVGRPDGTDAEYVFLRGVDRHVPRHVLEQRGGLLSLVSGRIGSRISIAVGAYQPGGTNSKPHLRELVAHTLAEFDLTGVID
jgi:hypothetical protein